MTSNAETASACSTAVGCGNACCTATTSSATTTIASVAPPLPTNPAPAASAGAAVDPALEAMMAQMELEAGEIDEDPQALQSDLSNRSLRMLTPEQVEERKKQAERDNMTPEKRRAALRKAIRDKQADRTRMSRDQQPTDARGHRLPGRQRLTKQQMQKAQSGHLGASMAGVNVESISAQQMAQATAMLKQNPHLMP